MSSKVFRLLVYIRIERFPLICCARDKADECCREVARIEQKLTAHLAALGEDQRRAAHDKQLKTLRLRQGVYYIAVAVPRQQLVTYPLVFVGDERSYKERCVCLSDLNAQQTCSRVPRQQVSASLWHLFSNYLAYKPMCRTGNFSKDSVEKATNCNESVLRLLRWRCLRTTSHVARVLACLLLNSPHIIKTILPLP